MTFLKFEEVWRMENLLPAETNYRSAPSSLGLKRYTKFCLDLRRTRLSQMHQLNSLAWFLLDGLMKLYGISFAKLLLYGERAKFSTLKT